MSVSAGRSTVTPFPATKPGCARSGVASPNREHEAPDVANPPRSSAARHFPCGMGRWSHQPAIEKLVNASVNFRQDFRQFPCVRNQSHDLSPFNDSKALDHSRQEIGVPVRQSSLEHQRIGTVAFDDFRIRGVWLPILDEHREHRLTAASLRASNIRSMRSSSVKTIASSKMTGARAPLRASIRANASRTSTAICSCVPPDSTANCSRVPVRSKAARSTSSASNRNSASGQASGHQRRGNRLEHDCSVPSFWLPLPCWAAFATNKESDRANVDFLALCRSY